MALPFEYELWTTEEVATYFKVTPKSFGARYASNPEFPRPIILPRADGKSTHPRWRAIDVVEWALSYSSTKNVPVLELDRGDLSAAR